MKKSVFIFLTVLMCVVCAPVLSSAAQTFDVLTQNDFFSPANLTINVGDTVRWTNPTGTPHTATSGAGCSHNTTGVVWDSGFLSMGESFSHTFDQPGTYPYFCSLHCFLGMTGTITVSAASTTIALPQTVQTFTYPAIVTPVLSADPAQARPIGLGDIAAGGPTLAVRVAMEQFEAPVDVYFLLYIPSVDPVNVYQFTSSGTFQTFSAGLAPWILSSPGPVDESLFGNITVADLPMGTYLLGVVVVPAGDQSLTKYYFWITEFTVGQ